MHIPVEIVRTELRPFWRRYFHFNAALGVGLLLIICIPRFFMVLNANVTGNYGSIGLVMVASALVPYLLLTSKGRKEIGIRKPINFKWIFYSFLVGIVMSTVIFLVGKGLYDVTINNWYVYIARSYNIADGLNAHDKLIYFLVFAGTGMIFSPIGEELFFRGIVHSSFASSYGEKRATIIESFAFALTHLAHFGIVYVSGFWEFLLIPSILWITAMFVTSLVFVRCKKATGSILGAIASHAGFNLAMIYCIFYHL